MRKTPSGKPIDKNKKSKSKNNKFRLVLIFVALGYVSWVFASQQIEIESSKKTLAQVESNIDQQKGLKTSLAQKIELVNTPEYLEKIARSELGYARPDEIIFYDATLKK